MNKKIITIPPSEDQEEAYEEWIKFLEYVNRMSMEVQFLNMVNPRDIAKNKRRLEIAVKKKFKEFIEKVKDLSSNGK